MAQVVKNKKHLVEDDVSRRRRRGRGGGKRKNRRGGRGQIYGSALTQLRKDVGYVMSMLNVEDKYIDISATTTASSAAWGFVILNTMVRGTSATTRIGQSIRWVGNELRWSLTMNATGQLPQFVRIVLFVDKQPNAANATMTDVYPLGILTPRDVGNLNRFTILYERVLAMNPDGNECFVGDSIRTLSQYHTMFNTGNAGDITDITKNALYLMWCSSVALNLPSFGYNNRFIFVDN
jgi:hypothetical protein